MATNVIGDVNFLQRRLNRRREHLRKLQETPHLKCVQGVAKGMEAWVDQVPFRLGRGFNNHLVLPDPGIGAFHGVVQQSPTGDYVVIAGDPDKAPIFVREWGRYRPRGSVALKDGTRVRLGRRGPILKYRYLGGEQGRKAMALSVLGGRQRDPLLPLPHLVSRLDEQRFSGSINPSARFFIDHAVRYLERLKFYQRWIFGWAMVLILLGGLIFYSQITAGQAHAELETARAQIRAHTLAGNRGRDDTGKATAQLNDSLLEGDRVAQGMLDILHQSGVTNPVIDQELVGMVKTQIDRETTRLRRRFDLEGFLARHERYHPRIQEIFEREFQIPPSLAYIAWVESDYRLDAESQVGALGMWQFMEHTATDYGLITEAGEDYRLNFESSTRAAGRYFSDLLAQFGLEHMMVAIASYNWGPNRFLYLMRRHQLWRPTQRSFTHMLKLRTTGDNPAIPKETREFVARWYAIHLVAEDMSFYLGSQ